jgi:hypothetical protein
MIVDIHAHYFPQAYIDLHLDVGAQARPDAVIEGLLGCCRQAPAGNAREVRIGVDSQRW